MAQLIARHIDGIAPAQERVVHLTARIFVLTVADRADGRPDNGRPDDHSLADPSTEPAVEDARRDVAAAAVVGKHHGWPLEATLHRVVRGSP
jgi:hypothetical protein